MISEVPNSQKVLSSKIGYYNLKPALPDVLLRELWELDYRKSKNPVFKNETFPASLCVLNKHVLSCSFFVGRGGEGSY